MFAGIIGPGAGRGRAGGHPGRPHRLRGPAPGHQDRGGPARGPRRVDRAHHRGPPGRRAAAAGLAAHRRSGCAGLLRGQLHQPAPEWDGRGSRPRVPRAGTLAGPDHRAARGGRPARDSRRRTPRTPSRSWSMRSCCRLPAPDRYRFHDLLRTYAAERALAEEPADGPGRRDPAAADLVPVHGRGGGPDGRAAPLPDPAARRPARMRSRSPSRVPDALKWCEVERANLVAGTRQAAASGCISWPGGWPSPASASSTGARTGRTGSRRIRSPWPAPGRSGTGGPRPWCMNNLGTAFTRQGMDEAAECFEQALAIRREIGDLLGEAQTRHQHGRQLLSS